MKKAKFEELRDLVEDLEVSASGISSGLPDPDEREEVRDFEIEDIESEVAALADAAQELLSMLPQKD